MRASLTEGYVVLSSPYHSSGPTPSTEAMTINKERVTDISVMVLNSGSLTNGDNLF
ncbi:hypothetical protein J6590_092636 [Homalodisca vitripennis]|nr:hypothetical protein J6590_092636 [Homalodisca vitripennis]